MTLSIVRSYRPADGAVQKFYYDENVFRVSETSRRFKEIRQTGLEFLGSLDEACIDEVLALLDSNPKPTKELLNTITTILRQEHEIQP